VLRHFLKMLLGLGHLRLVRLDGAQIILGDFAFGGCGVPGRKAGKGLGRFLILRRLRGEIEAEGIGGRADGRLLDQDRPGQCFFSPGLLVLSGPTFVGLCASTDKEPEA
jgi:hypothetical protein